MPVLYAVLTGTTRGFLEALSNTEVFHSLPHQGFCVHQSWEVSLSQLINQMPKQTLVCDP